MAVAQEALFDKAGDIAALRGAVEGTEAALSIYTEKNIVSDMQQAEHQIARMRDKLHSVD